MTFLYVFLGGGIGSICRYGIGRWMAGNGYNFPFATLLANVISCIVLGALMGFSLRAAMSPNHRLLLITGFCGGFSTFSTFSAETFQLFEDGQHLYALANIFFSLILCLISIYLGIRMVNQFS